MPQSGPGVVPPQPPGINLQSGGESGPTAQFDPWQQYRQRDNGGTGIQTAIPKFMVSHLLSEPQPTDRKRFNDKVALTTGKQFDGVNQGGSWLKWARNYFNSQAMEMDYLLRIAESSENAEVTTQSVQSMSASWIHPERVHVLS